MIKTIERNCSSNLHWESTKNKIAITILSMESTEPSPAQKYGLLYAFSFSFFTLGPFGQIRSTIKSTRKTHKANRIPM